MRVFILAVVSCATFLMPSLYAQESVKGDIDFQIRNYGYDIGFGVQRKAKKIDWNESVGLRLGSINHPKEVFVINQVLPASEPFVMDKISRVWAVKPYIQKSIQISKHQSRFDIGFELFGALKIPMAYSWPIYVWVQDIRQPFDSYREVKYNPTDHPPEQIGGEVSYFKGFNEGRLIPGIGANLGFSLVWGAYRNWENRLSLGFSQDLFVKELPLMHSIDRNPQYLPAVFLNFALVFGGN